MDGNILKLEAETLEMDWQETEDRIVRFIEDYVEKTGQGVL